MSSRASRPSSQSSHRRSNSGSSSRRGGPNWTGGIVYAIVGLLVLLFVLNRLILRGQLALGPTPTPSKTPSPFVTATPNVQATLQAQEAQTQTAIAAIAVGETPPTPLPTPTGTPSHTPTPTRDIFLPTVTPTPRQTFIALIPDVVGGPQQTPSPTADVPALIETPTPEPSAPELTQTAAAAATTAAETATATLLPTVTPTGTPTATPLPPVAPVIATLQAFAKEELAVLDGPSSLYTKIATLPQNQRLILQGRDAVGDWLYVCCEANVAGWVRQASLRLEGNELPPGAPVDSKANDVRWLTERPPDRTLDELRLPTPIPDADYPQFRRDPSASANVPRAFLPPYRSVWLDAALAGGPMSSPAVVVGPSVMVASEDLHLYSFERETGNQRWRREFGQVIRGAPVVQDANIYLATDDGQVHAVQDQGNQAAVLWSRAIGVQPATSVNKKGTLLFVAGQNQQLYALNRLDGSIRWAELVDGLKIQHPATGERSQLVYAGNGNLQARDIFSGTLIWNNSDADEGIAAPPVYSFPGVVALAELYAADNLGTIRSHDANTGEVLWLHQDARRTTALAVDETRLYATGGAFLKAIDRSSGQRLWEQPLSDGALSGPIVGGGRVLVVSVSGVIRVFDAVQGTLLHASNLPTSAIGGAAVSGPWLFVPGANGRLYERKEVSAN